VWKVIKYDTELTVGNSTVEFMRAISDVIHWTQKSSAVLNYPTMSNSAPAERHQSNTLPNEKHVKIQFQSATKSARRLSYAVTHAKHHAISTPVHPVSSSSTQNAAAVKQLSTSNVSKPSVLNVYANESAIL
jgi:hypothetical protein